ncbi:hypothetical protein [Nonomuraea fuscirosea]|uniref:hypothetical protein n=1 Tax=Nonomuraea fuscirosea TaxID=1291556 RepID=UPI0034404355
MKKKMRAKELRDVLQRLSGTDSLEMEILLNVIESKSHSAMPILDDKDLEDAIGQTVEILEKRNNALSQTAPDWIEVLSASESRTGDRDAPRLGEFSFPAQSPRKGH